MSKYVWLCIAGNQQMDKYEANQWRHFFVFSIFLLLSNNTSPLLVTTAKTKRKRKKIVWRWEERNIYYGSWFILSEFRNSFLFFIFHVGKRLVYHHNKRSFLRFGWPFSSTTKAQLSWFIQLYQRHTPCYYACASTGHMRISTSD